MIEKFFKLITFPQDKANHAFWLTFVFTLLSIFIDIYYALGVITLIAIAKEVYDSKHRDIHAVDVYDFEYGVFPSLFIVIVDIVWRYFG